MHHVQAYLVRHSPVLDSPKDKPDNEVNDADSKTEDTHNRQTLNLKLCQI